MNAEQIFTVIKKLTGEVSPVGERNADAERLENMKLFIGVFEKMHMVIDSIAHGYKDSQYASEKAIGLVAHNHIESMGIQN